MNKFWMVMVEGRGMPQIRHPTFEKARTEAERLIRKEGKGAYILEAVAVGQVQNQPVSWTYSIHF